MNYPLGWLQRPVRCKIGVHLREVDRDYFGLYYWRCALCYVELERWPWLEKKFETEYTKLCDREESENVVQLFKRRG